MNRRALLRSALVLPVAGISLGLSISPPLPAMAEAAGAGRSPARKAARAARLLMLDPGHGGHDPGAIGGRGTHEKDVTLDIAKELARQVERSGGMKVVLTRDTDVFLPLKERVQRARSAKADLFISIHADSAPNGGARGLSAYTLSETASDAFAAALAHTENLADGLGVDMSNMDQDVAAILMDLAARHTRTAALQAKQALVRGAGRELRLLDNPMRSANFAVLKAPDVPSVLIETGFLSNREDEQLLREPTSRRRIAGILSRELTALMKSAPFA
ncbi:N-acetylmuramoyl-L-alanine amidase family protein [Oleisolibacter albus]|uniref:N-acetylmuramoyl-L-alanine amidase family protein n=1 Tax=Oleisolibacter albus TaxID=2171757 RepID=UPI000DF2D661|nr:N-acetylmuramoyl-L-alanine amidase [Oleisolibacter albus]